MTRYPEWVIDPKKFPIWQAPDSSRKVSPLIGKENCGAKWISAGLFWVIPGQKTIPDIHQESEELYYVVSGQGDIVLDGETHHVVQGMVMYIAPGVTHQSINTGEQDLCYFWIFSPPPAGPRTHEVENWPRIR